MRARKLHDLLEQGKNYNKHNTIILFSERERINEIKVYIVYFKNVARL